MRRLSFLGVLVALYLGSVLSQQPKHQSADDGDYEFVQEVIEEENEHYGDAYDYDNPYVDERTYQAQQEELKKRQRQQEEQQRRIEEQRQEQIRNQREQAFEKEIQSMKDEAAKKAAIKQKKRDGKIVKQILRAAEREDHYKVLGLRNWEIGIPSLTIKVLPLSPAALMSIFRKDKETKREKPKEKFVIKTPALRLFHISEKKIRKAYRKLSREVHPDRNKDGSAEVAFIALENSASILSDSQLRQRYDEQCRLVRRQQRRYIQHLLSQSIGKVFNILYMVLKGAQRVLGPFSVPALIYGSILL